MKKTLVILLVIAIILTPVIFAVTQYTPIIKKEQTEEILESSEEDSGVLKGVAETKDGEIYGTDVPLQGNELSETIDTSSLIKLDEGMISDYDLEEVAKMFLEKQLYYDPENTGGHALFIAHVTDEKEVEGSDKEKFVAMLQHSTRNLKLLAVKVDDEWSQVIKDRDSEEFLKYADDRAYQIFTVAESFIVNYNSVFLEVQQMILTDKNGNIVIVGGDIIVA